MLWGGRPAPLGLAGHIRDAGSTIAICDLSHLSSQLVPHVQNFGIMQCRPMPWTVFLSTHTSSNSIIIREVWDRAARCP